MKLKNVPDETDRKSPKICKFSVKIKKKKDILEKIS